MTSVIDKGANYYDRLTLDNRTAFRQARVKLKRARRHILEVQTASRELPRKSPYQFVVGANQRTGNLQLIFISHNPLPLEFSAAVGDAVHALHTIFDYAAVGLTAAPIGKGNPHYAGFPTGEDQTKFLKASQDKMAGAPVEALQIIEALEPYGDDPHSLRALHQLDILDKHKMIVPAVSAMTIDGMKINVGGKDYILQSTDFEANDDGSNLNATVDIPYNPQTEFISKGSNLSFKVVFGKGQPLEGRPIAESLIGLADTAEHFINECEGKFPDQVHWNA